MHFFISLFSSAATFCFSPTRFAFISQNSTQLFLNGQVEDFTCTLWFHISRLHQQKKQVLLKREGPPLSPNSKTQQKKQAQQFIIFIEGHIFCFSITPNIIFLLYVCLLLSVIVSFYDVKVLNSRVKMNSAVVLTSTFKLSLLAFQNKSEL